MSTLITNLGNQISLGPKIGEGGEGAVFEIVGRIGYVAKIYHSPPSPELADKLGILAKFAGDDEVARIAAIPRSTLTDQRGKVVGFYMAQLKDCFPIHDVYHPENRKVNLRDWDFRHQVVLAKNVALGFARLHRAGIVVGDVNENSILVTKDCLARFIDTDSFQLKVGARTFKCVVGVPDYTAPELLGKNFANIERTKTSDSFSLAILIYQLLVAGRHPFSTAGLDREEAIRKSAFAFRNREVFTKDPIAKIVWSNFPLQLQNLFESAFTENPQGRPSGADWFKGLTEVEGLLSQVCKSPSHFSFRNKCPWCRVALLGIDLYPDQRVVPKDSSTYRTLLDGIAAKASQLRADYKLAPLSMSYPKFPAPLSLVGRVVKFSGGNSCFDDEGKVGFSVTVVICALIFWLAIAGFGWTFGGTIASFLLTGPFVAAFGFGIGEFLSSRLSPRKKFEAMLNGYVKSSFEEFSKWVRDFDSLVSKESNPVDQVYSQTTDVVQSARRWLKWIDGEERANARQLAEAAITKVEISNRNFPEVTSSYLDKIRWAGIVNASQLESGKLMRITGIGKVTTDRMMKRKSLLVNRSYDPQNELLSGDARKKLNGEYRNLKQRIRVIENTLSQSKTEFETTKEKIALKFKDGERLSQNLANVLASLTDFSGSSKFYEDALLELAKVSPSQLVRKHPRWPIMRY
jgi:DNA-binding helix-hairpin-helix protein with protein kinase domain